MKKATRFLILAMPLLAIQTAWATARTRATPGSESLGWATIQAKVQAGSTAGETAKLLQEFLENYPEGVFAADARFALAEAMFQSGHYPQALENFSALASKKGSLYFSDSMLRVAEIQYNQGEVAKAQKTFQKLADKAGGTLVGAEAYYGLALCQMQNEDYRNAIHSIDYLMSKYPAYATLPKTKELLGILRYQEKEYAKAVEILQGAGTPAGALYRGMSHFYQKQYQEAAQAFNTLADMPNNSQAEMGLYLKAESFRMVQNGGLTAKAYGEFVQRFPNSRFKTQALIDEAYALKNSGRVPDALKILQELNMRNATKDEQVDALYLEAEIAAQQGDYQKARELPQKARLLGRNQPERYARIHLILTYYLLKIGKVKEATAEMRELLRQIPMHPMGNVAFLLFGIDARSEHDLRKTISSYETALLKYEYSPLSDVSMAMLLGSYLDAGKYQELVTHANQVMSVLSNEYSTQDMRWKAQSYMLIAEAYYRLKSYAEASRYYDQALKEPSLTDQARLYLAWSKYHEGKFSESTQLAQKIMGQRFMAQENRVSAHLLLATSHFNQGNYDRALDLFASFRQNYPASPHVPECWLYEGWAHRQQGDYADALRSWKKLIAQYPAGPEAQEGQIQIGLLYFQARKYKNAINEFTAFLTRWPKSPLASEALWLMAQTYYNSQQDAMAIKAYRAFAMQFPEHRHSTDAQNQLMLTYYRQAMRGRDPQLLSQFVSMYPKSHLAPEAQYQLAQDAFQGKKWAVAIEHFRTLLLNYPMATQAPLALLAIAQSQDRLKKPAEAITEYRSLVNLFPNHPASIDAAMRLGALYFEAGNFKEAANSFRFVVEREAPAPIKASAMYNLGMSHKKQRNFVEAAQAFDTFAETYPADPKQMDALLEIAALQRLLDKPDQAVVTYEKILNRPNTPAVVKMGICNQTAELYRGIGDKQKAIGAYGLLLGMGPAAQDERLLGLAQLAAIYEEDEVWNKALDVYNHIRTSGGKPEWVKSAAKRAKEIKTFLEARKNDPKVATGFEKDKVGGR